MKIRMTQSSCTSLLVFALLGLAACSNPTTLERTWKAPEVGSLKFSKVLVVALVPDGDIRRAAEDAIKANITSVPSVASYEMVMDKETLKDRTKMATIIHDSGADGIVVLRPIADMKEVPPVVSGTDIPPPYTGMWGYYTRPYGMSAMYWDSSTTMAEGIVGMETNIYDVKSENLVWSGFTKTKDPKDVKDLVNQVAAAVKAKMQQQKLIP